MNEFMQRLAGIVGADALAEPEAAAPLALPAVAVCRPATLAALQALVRSAPRLGIQLAVTPNAAGNGAMHGHAGKALVLVDLSRLDRILEVDAANGYALVEPGVSFAALHRHLQERELGLWIDCDRNGLNSVSGSIAERGFGFTPYGDHLMMQCGMEVMLASGELVRTGMGALPGANTWQLFKYGYGPYIDGLFTQSNFAIVTKMGLWLMPAPPAYRPFMVKLDGQAGLAGAMELLRPLRIHQIVPNTVVVSHALMDLAPYARRSDFAAAGAVDVGRARAAHDLGLWNVYGALYGLPDNVEATWETLEPAFAGLPGARLELAREPGAHTVWYHRERAMRGVPDSAAARLGGWNGSGLLSLTATGPIDGEDAERMFTLAAAALGRAGFDPLIEFALGWRAALMHVNLGYPADDAAQAAAARGAALEAAGALQQAGYPIAHCSPALLEAIEAPRAGSALADLNARLRRVLDPEEVFLARPDGKARL